MPGASDISGPSGTRGREALRATLTRFDARQRKIVGGVIALMIENPERVREREWIAEQFTEVTLLACGFEDLVGAQEGRQRLRAFVRENIAPLLNVCYELFQQVGADLAQRPDLTRQDAVEQALSYFADAPA